MHVIHTTDTNSIGTGTTHASAHGVQEVSQVDHMRLTGCVMDRCIAVRTSSCQQYIDRTTDSNTVHEDIGADHITLCIDHAAVIVDLRAQCTESFHMLFKGTISDRTATGISHFTLTAAAKQRTPKIITCTHALGIGIRNMERIDRPRVHCHTTGSRVVINFGPQKDQHVVNDVYVLDVWQVLHSAWFVTQQSSRQHGKRSILAAIYAGLTAQRIAARNKQLITVHAVTPL